MMRRISTMTGLATLALGLAACSDSATGPTGEEGFDSQAASANLTTFDAFFQSPEWKSYLAFGDRVEASGVHAAVLPALDDRVGDPRDEAELAAEAIRQLFATSRVPVISEGALGKTFVLDPATGEYVHDPARTDAPSNGVRFILYRPIAGSDDPDPDNELGYMQLVDLGAGTAGIDLELTAVGEGITFLQYGVSLEGEEGNGSVDVDGFLSDGPNRLDFSFRAVATDVGGEERVDIDASLDVNSEDFHVTLDIDGLDGDDDENVSIDLLVEYQNESIRVVAMGSDDAVSAVFRVNGDVFATAEGTEDELVILGASGEPITADELHVLELITDMSDDVIEFFGELLEPAGDIVELGIAL